MESHDPENLDDVISQEKHLIAREHFLDAWEAGLLDGIDAEIIARELIAGALRQITREQGAQAATSLICEIQAQDEQGDFLPAKTVQ